MVMEDGWVEFVPKESTISEEVVAIEKAKQSLSSSDYKVIKCMEAYLVGEPLPYDINELHKERDLQRQIINEAEAAL